MLSGIARCGLGGRVSGWGEEAGFDGVGGELAHLVEGELAELLDEDVFVEEVGAEHGWIVGVDGDHEAGVEVVGEGVFVEAGTAAGADVRGDVDLDGDLALGEDGEEFVVVLGGEAVADGGWPMSYLAWV
jgi:hypothetical protein